MKILGIDNGLAGGMVCNDRGVIIGRQVMPTVDSGNGKHEYDVQLILDIFDSWKPEKVIIERAHPFPGQGVTSMFSIGKGFGLMLGIINTLKISHEIVSAITWQKTMFKDIPKGDTKASSAVVCKRLWPSIDWRASERCKIIHSGLTDAALMAEYGRRKF